VEAALHREQALDVLQNNELRLVPAEDVHDGFKERAPWVANALLFAGAAEGLARETSGEEVVRGDLGVDLADVGFAEGRRAKAVAVDRAGPGAVIVGPDGSDLTTVCREAKAADPRKQLDRAHALPPRPPDSTAGTQSSDNVRLSKPGQVKNGLPAQNSELTAGTGGIT
jgi:hypothetical protein